MANTTLLYVFLFIAAITLIFAACRNQSQANDKITKLGNGFSKRQNTILLNNEALSQIDAASFKLLDEAYFTDRNGVYYYHSFRESRNYFLTKQQHIRKLEEVDASSFLALGYGYGKDELHVWHDGKIIRLPDAKSFEVIDFHFSKDAQNAYLNDEVIEDADGSSFELINNQYVKDKDHCFYVPIIEGKGSEVKIISAALSSFQILDHPYARDENVAFFRGEKITGADAKSFSVIGNHWSKDDFAVYYEDILVGKRFDHFYT